MQVVQIIITFCDSVPRGLTRILIQYFDLSRLNCLNFNQSFWKIHCLSRVTCMYLLICGFNFLSFYWNEDNSCGLVLCRESDNCHEGREKKKIKLSSEPRFSDIIHRFFCWVRAGRSLNWTALFDTLKEFPRTAALPAIFLVGL